ncbi:VQ motif-containing protein 17-like [Neltuma alba]|uniref:VQ motif-containing protein 17-like n=1 Tax=Neltuma alba TaxID=207710 RepID=UPI0010A2C5BD|nr:VQ motif-containing protein 17-like [Prosopis alba]
MEKGVKRETSCTENKIRNSNGGGGGVYPGMHKHSQTISKMKPKIRIIHIFAQRSSRPMLTNFRQLVQRLTGKPGGRQNYTKNTKQATHIPQESIHVADPSRGMGGCGLHDETVKMELRMDHQSREGLIKKEQDFYNGEISSGEYLRGLEGFISEFGDFPFFPNWDAAHRHTQEFQDTLLS